jgi:hypothetical protein
MRMTLLTIDVACTSKFRFHSIFMSQLFIYTNCKFKTACHECVGIDKQGARICANGVKLTVDLLSHCLPQILHIMRQHINCQFNTCLHEEMRIFTKRNFFYCKLKFNRLQNSNCLVCHSYYIHYIGIIDLISKALSKFSIPQNPSLISASI